MLLLSKDASFMLVFSWMLDQKIGCFRVSKVASFLKKSIQRCYLAALRKKRTLGASRLIR